MAMENVGVDGRGRWRVFEGDVDGEILYFISSRRRHTRFDCYWSSDVCSSDLDGYAWTYDDGSKHLAKVLQLQTAINPGNSGGPVVDDAGRILGLVAMSEEGQNLDYAIAADVIKRFLFTGMHITIRGIDRRTSASKSPQHLFSAKLADSILVSKA